SSGSKSLRSPSQRRRVKRQIAAEIAAALGFRYPSIRIRPPSRPVGAAGEVPALVRVRSNAGSNSALTRISGCRMEDGDGEAAREAIAARMRAGDYTGARTLLLETLQTNPG
uniref:Uncharacterized protein n=1 Tax=Aegilops tauschii subsp. strangulata TaxID=200361 RepID=A0A453GE25_AEGTS